MKSFSSEILQKQENWGSQHFKKKVGIILSHQKNEGKIGGCAPNCKFLLL